MDNNKDNLDEVKNNNSNNNDEIDNTNEEEWEEIELSPNRNKIFSFGFYYFIGVLITAYPVFLLAKALKGALGLPLSIVAIFLYLLILLPSFKIWKTTHNELQKNDDYAYDGKLKFSYYIGMVGTLLIVTLVFVAVMTGIMWAFKPSPFNADIVSVNGEELSIKEFQTRYVSERPTIRPAQLKRTFGAISFKNFKILSTVNRFIDNATEDDIRKKYDKNFSSVNQPIKRLLFNEVRKYCFRYVLYQEGNEYKQRNADFRKIIEYGNLYDKLEIASRALTFKLVYERQKKYEPKVADLSLVENVNKLREVLEYKRINIYLRNHQNKRAKALEQAMKAYNALKANMKWKKAFTKFNQRIRTRGPMPDPDKIHKANRMDEKLTQFFNKNKGFISKPIKTPAGFIIIKVVNVKKLTDKELLKNQIVKRKIKSVYLKKFEKEYEQMLETTYKSKIKLNINLLFGNKESNEAFIEAGDKVKFPVVFFWKNLTQAQKNKFSNPAKRADVIKYVNENYVKNIMAYLEAEKRNLLKIAFVKLQLNAETYSRIVQTYINLYLVPKMIDPVLKKAGIEGIKKFYKQNARYFNNPMSRYMRRRTPTKPKKWNQLDENTKKRVKGAFKNQKMREVLLPYITDKLFKKYKIKINKKYFIRAVPQQQLRSMS